MTISWKTVLPPDADHAVRRVVINQGDYSLSDDPRTVITTVLGSCVAACLRDPRLGLGGMNHFVLPRPLGQKASAGDQSRYGCFLMEQLIDALLKQGAALNRIEAKLYGGASSTTCRSTVGERNIDFATRFLVERGITITEAYVGGSQGCRLEFWPASGKTSISLVQCIAHEGLPQATPARKPRG